MHSKKKPLCSDAEGLLKHRAEKSLNSTLIFLQVIEFHGAWNFAELPYWDRSKLQQCLNQPP